MTKHDVEIGIKPQAYKQKIYMEDSLVLNHKLNSWSHLLGNPRDSRWKFQPIIVCFLEVPETSNW